MNQALEFVLDVQQYGSKVALEKHESVISSITENPIIINFEDGSKATWMGWAFQID